MNSLTANNSVSQQLVVGMAVYQLFRHECRLSNGQVISNHRGYGQAVGQNHLYDRINDAAARAGLINLLLNPSEVRGRK
jgi:hypothetical protein